MLDNAITKLQSEMNQSANNPYVQVVGGFLLQHLEENPGSVEKILNEDKTIAKSLDEMRKVAEKRKVGNCAVLTDQEGFEVVLKYFGIDATIPMGTATTKPVRPREVPQPTVSETDFDIRLEDLL